MKLYLSFLLVLVSGGFNRPAHAPQATLPSGWQEVKSTDWVKEPRRQFTLAGKFLAPAPSKLEGDPASLPALLLKCRVNRRSGGEGKFRVGAVVVGTLLKIHMVEAQEIKAGVSYYPEVSVSYRFDDGKPVDDDWPPRYDKTSAEFDKLIFKKMLRAHSVLIVLHDKNNSELRMQFDMPELFAAPAEPLATAAAAALPIARTPAQVAEACGIDEHEK